jgi:hypothetical protein
VRSLHAGALIDRYTLLICPLTLGSGTQIRTIDTSYIAGELVDYLSRDDKAQLEHSLSRYLGLLRLSNRVE